jgi:hypothetical protein
VKRSTVAQRLTINNKYIIYRGTVGVPKLGMKSRDHICHLRGYNGCHNNTKFSLHLYNHKRWEILMIMSVNKHGVIALAGTPCVEYIWRQYTEYCHFNVRRMISKFKDLF